MTVSMRVETISLLLALATAVGCADPELDVIQPVLVITEATPTDATERAEYLVEFGEVVVGGRFSKSVMIRNAGRSPLTLQKPLPASPFGTELTDLLRLEPGTESELVFVLRPTAAGALEAIVSLDSDGGDITVRLTATAKLGAPADCEFSVEPLMVDFGNVPRGSTKALGFRLVNAGSSTCEVKRLSISAGSDASFALPEGTIGAATIAAHSDLPVFVSFTPTRYAARFTGKIEFWAGPPERVAEFPLEGSSAEPCPGALPDGSCPAATESVYVNLQTALSSHDPVAHRSNLLGTFKENGRNIAGGMTDIAIDLNGTMIGVASTKLYVINPTTAQVAFLATIDHDANGLTFLPDGRLVTSGKAVKVVDRTTGRTLQTIVPDGSFDTSGDIVGLPDGMLYWTVDGGAKDKLVRINPANGSTTVVGTLSVSGIWGLGYANGELYGYTNGGRVLAINPATAATTENTALAGGWWGATTNPVTW